MSAIGDISSAAAPITAPSQLLSRVDSCSVASGLSPTHAEAINGASGPSAQTGHYHLLMCVLGVENYCIPNALPLLEKVLANNSADLQTRPFQGALPLPHIPTGQRWFSALLRLCSSGHSEKTRQVN